MAKKKRKMSAAARRKIGLAQKKRWAAFRRARGKSTGRRGRPPKAAASSGNPYLKMTVAELAAGKQQLDEAWKTAKKMLRWR